MRENITFKNHGEVVGFIDEIKEYQYNSYINLKVRDRKWNNAESKFEECLITLSLIVNNKVLDKIYSRCPTLEKKYVLIEYKAGINKDGDHWRTVLRVDDMLVLDDEGFGNSNSAAAPAPKEGGVNSDVPF